MDIIILEELLRQKKHVQTCLDDLERIQEQEKDLYVQINLDSMIVAKICELKRIDKIIKLIENQLP